eukprot:757803-Hanusia_phi.AAC.1
MFVLTDQQLRRGRLNLKHELNRKSSESSASKGVAVQEPSCGIPPEHDLRKATLESGFVKANQIAGRLIIGSSEAGTGVQIPNITAYLHGKDCIPKSAALVKSQLLPIQFYRFPVFTRELKTTIGCCTWHRVNYLGTASKIQVDMVNSMLFRNNHEHHHRLPSRST